MKTVDRSCHDVMEQNSVSLKWKPSPEVSQPFQPVPRKPVQKAHQR